MNKGNWIAMDKELIAALPFKRPYTIIEAVFSYQVDTNNHVEKSLNEYARIWGWSRSKVTQFVRQSKVTHTDTPKATQRPIKFRFINQLNNSKDRPATEQRPTSNRPATTTNNINLNLKNNKESIQVNSAKFKKPTVDEIDLFCKKRNNGIDAEAFFHHYESCGWVIGKNKPMKSWKSSVVTWEKRNRSHKVMKETDIYKPRISYFCKIHQTDHYHNDENFKECLITKNKEKQDYQRRFNAKDSDDESSYDAYGRKLKVFRSII